MEGLNTPDHLPIIADMKHAPVSAVSPSYIFTKIDWKQAISSGDIEIYRNTIAKHLNQLASNSHDCIDDVEKKLNSVCKLLSDSTEHSLPHVQKSQRQHWKDTTLHSLCSKSRQARKAWKEAGSPAEGFHLC